MRPEHGPRTKTQSALWSRQCRPSVVSDPDGAVADAYKAIARKVAIFVAQKAEDFSTKFPNIVVQNT